MKLLKNSGPGHAGCTPVTRRQVLRMIPAAALAVAAVPLLFGGAPDISKTSKAGEPVADLPRDTLLHGAGWCIPH